MNKQENIHVFCYSKSVQTSDNQDKAKGTQSHFAMKYRY